VLAALVAASPTVAAASVAALAASPTVFVTESVAEAAASFAFWYMIIRLL